MASIAFLGTGLLGSAFVEAACKRGDQVAVWNRTPGKAEPLAAFGATLCATPADAVRGAERVHLVLNDDASVEEVVAALRPGLSPTAVIVDHTTTRPDRTSERLTRLNGEGVGYLHCPVFIGPVAARQSEGIIMVSGPQALFDRVRPALERQATRVEYFGERADLAAGYKLVGNGILLSMTGILSDAFAVGAGAGIEAPDVLKLLDFFNLGNVLASRGRKLAAADYHATFELTMARKDIRLMIETAGTLPLTMLPGLAARMDAKIAEGRGARDIGVIVEDVIR
jgi:3-hydroxyisobutyrate dehydrogenase-like beta-hydroxyacid dehydrogenase